MKKGGKSGRGYKSSATRVLCSASLLQRLRVHSSLRLASPQVVLYRWGRVEVSCSAGATTV